MKVIPLGSASDGLDTRKSGVILLAIVALCVAQSILAAIAQPFWYDEILTVILSRLPGAHEIWNALQNAADTHPPLFFIVARFARHIVPDDHLAFRLPSILGLSITITFVYLALSKRVSHLSALVGATFLLSTELVAFAYEARPYSLMIACAAVAVFAWQRIDESWCYVPVFACALGLSLLTHYYAIFVWPAFVLGELAVCLWRRNLRIRVWLSLLVGALPLLFCAGLLAELRSYYGRDYWSRPEFKQTYITYNELLNVASHWGIVLVVGIALAILYSARKQILQFSSGKSGDCGPNNFPVEEQLLILGLMFLPAVAVFATKLSHGGLTGRHMLPAILGIAMGLGFVIERVPYKGRVLLLGLLIANYEGSAVPTVRYFMGGTLHAQRDAAAQAVGVLVKRADKSNLPLVIGSGLSYLPMTYYAPSGSGEKIHVLVDPSQAVRYLKTASADLNLLAIQHYSPLHVESYSEFVAHRRKFLLVSGGDFDWLTSYLVDEKTSLRLVTPSGADGISVYEVTMLQ